MYKVMYYIKSPSVRILNVWGLSGLGKTRFVVETAYYLHARWNFPDGIFLLDVTNFRSVEQIKYKLRDANITNSPDINGDL